MGSEMHELHQQRLDRYVTALRNGKPDRVPIRPFVAEFTARYAGYTCQQVTHDYELAFDAVRQCAAAFDWDAVVPNMVYVWTGLTEAIGLNYYAIPGVHIPTDTGFQYREPPEDKAFMRVEEYDALIADPTGFLLNTWLPRVAGDVCGPGEPVTARNNLSFLKGGMAMMQYFAAFGPQLDALRDESGTVSAIAGILKAPLDILADKLRGYFGLCVDLLERPDKVLAACEALAPHLAHVALGTGDPTGLVPVALWMHRGCVPFVSHDAFDTIYWPTLKPIIEAIWAGGNQTLLYAEGRWGPHLAAFAELPPGSVVYHVDQDDIFEVNRVLGSKFCLSGGIPNDMLAMGTPKQIRERCERVIDGVAGDGGYIMDASAIVQNDAKVENIKAMTDVTRAYGVYPQGENRPATTPAHPSPEGGDVALPFHQEGAPRPGVCIGWDEKLRELPPISGDAALMQRVWEDTDALAYTYIWQCLLSF